MTAADDDSSWRDDLATEMVYAYLSKAVAAAACEEIDHPHIVVCRDRETGAVSYSGPYPDGLTALVVAERESSRDPMDFSVAALFPAAATGGSRHA